MIPDWSDQIAVVIASGPSATHAGIEQLRERTDIRAVCVNDSWRLAPWGDVLYATDWQWWHAHYQASTAFAGVRLSSTRKRIARDFPGVSEVPVALVGDDRRPTFILEPKGLIGSGGNSGFQAMNIALQTGARRLIMVGFDMTLSGGSHWHGDHKNGLGNPRADLMEKWRNVLDGQARRLQDRGIDVINASPVSALKNYRKATIKEALEQW